MLITEISYTVAINHDIHATFWHGPNVSVNVLDGTTWPERLPDICASCSNLRDWELWETCVKNLSAWWWMCQFLVVCQFLLDTLWDLTSAYNFRDVISLAKRTVYWLSSFSLVILFFALKYILCDTKSNKNQLHNFYLPLFNLHGFYSLIIYIYTYIHIYIYIFKCPFYILKHVILFGNFDIWSLYGSNLSMYCFHWLFFMICIFLCFIIFIVNS